MPANRNTSSFAVVLPNGQNVQLEVEPNRTAEEIAGTIAMKANLAIPSGHVPQLYMLSSGEALTGTAGNLAQLFASGSKIGLRVVNVISVPDVMPQQVSISDPSQQTFVGKRRNPCAPLFLPLITLGIYTLVWIYKLFNEARLYANKRNKTKITSGGAAVGFLFIPVFNIVWGIMLSFKIPGLVTRMRQADGVHADQRGSTGALGFLMLIPIIGGILWVILTQKAINSFWKEAPRKSGFSSVIHDASRPKTGYRTLFVILLVFLIAGAGAIAGVVLYQQGQLPLPVETKYGFVWKTHQKMEREQLRKPTYLGPNLDGIIMNSMGMKLVYVPADEFMMGSPSSEQHRDSDEGPQHRVNISKSFYIGVYEVTQAQYKAMIGINPSRFKGDNLPVENVSWNDATEFCRKLSHKEGKTYRLPTEAEWEYACRGGTTTKFCFGNRDSELDAYAWSADRKNNNDNQTHPVGQKKSNAFGLYDMHGNVWEWCQDLYGENYYSNSPSVDPQGPDMGYGRVLRGGSWGYSLWYCRSASRYSYSPHTRDESGFYGFRVVLELVPTTKKKLIIDTDLVVGDSEPDDGQGSSGMMWVSINDPGVSGHEGFNGQMNKYETTNAKYCQFLTAALTSGDIIVSDSTVYGANGSNSGADFVGQVYYDLAGAGNTYNGATNGGAARINWAGSSFTVDSGFENHPVTYVSWYGATAFCNYYGWRLPTEWEWQAVADYNGNYYGCGISINNSIANYSDSTHPYGTTAVGAFGTYGYGMCEMAGNVGEWTSSIYSGNRIIRGGNWYFDVDHCAVWDRIHDSPDGADNYTGFRVCR